MKRNYLLLCLCSVLIFACGKDGGGSGGGTSEAALVITTSPTNGSNLAAQAIPASGLDLTVTVNSTMPSGGVKVDVVALNQTTNVSFFTNSVSGSSATNAFKITGFPTGSVTCKCNVTVTSLSSSSNVATSSFTFAAK